jgi:hypothetical protein
MKLKEFIIESAIVSAKAHIRDHLMENINDYLALVIAQLSNKKPQDLFKENDPKSLDLDHLALMITGLKIIAEPDYRAAITKRDVGVNVNDARELFNLLNLVDKQGHDPDTVNNVFKALCKLAPPALKRQREELEILKIGDDAQRKHAIQDLQKFSAKTVQIFNKVRQSAQSTRGVDVPNLGAAGRLNITV